MGEKIAMIQALARDKEIYFIVGSALAIGWLGTILYP